jgi:hypothetical protein
MAYANAEERTSLIVGLRDLADFLDGNPEVPVPCRADVMVFPPASTDKEMRAEVDRIAGLIDAEISDRTAEHGHYTASLEFGRMRYEAVGIPARSRVCRDAQLSYSDNVVVPNTDEEA